jgi:hypothetical protein
MCESVVDEVERKVEKRAKHITPPKNRSKGFRSAESLMEMQGRLWKARGGEAEVEMAATNISNVG